MPSPTGTTFPCRLVPGCSHDGNYLCTPRRELPIPGKDCRLDAYTASRGACNRLCHFDALCDSFHWSREGCHFCAAKGLPVRNTWFFSGLSPEPVPGSIAEWHHGWHSGPIISAWTGKIDLVAENYISPNPMGFEERHILLPGVTYHFTGHNCFLEPWRVNPGSRIEAERMRESREAWWYLLGLIALMIGLILLMWR